MWLRDLLLDFIDWLAPPPPIPYKPPMRDLRRRENWPKYFQTAHLRRQENLHQYLERFRRERYEYWKQWTPEQRTKRRTGRRHY